jgi:hypothetical protein
MRLSTGRYEPGQEFYAGLADRDWILKLVNGQITGQHPLEWVNEYWSLPRVTLDEVARSFGDHFLEITTLSRLREEVPAQIVERVPSGLDPIRVYKYWTLAMQAKFGELRTLLEQRIPLTQRAVVEPTAPGLPDFYAAMVQFSAEYTIYLMADAIATTQVWWNTNQRLWLGMRDAGAGWKADSEQRRSSIKVYAERLVSESPHVIQRLGFTHEMWQFFGLPWSTGGF